MTQSDLSGESRPIASSGPFDVRFADASASEDTEDAALVTSLVEIVNRVYRETEADLFLPGVKRTDEAEISRLAREGLLAVAYGPIPHPHPGQNHRPDQHSDQQQRPASPKPVGCVYVKQLSPTLGNFGMLAIDAEHQGGGLGRAMVRFAEEHCRDKGCTVMQLELLVPATSEHAFKSRMQAWYQRMGYRLVKLGNFNQDYPDLAPRLAGPAEYRVFEKHLAQEPAIDVSTW
ncbi:Acyl-CoA N-acyltransferase [Metarhizium rileyi]|uniref:Acyl-CoA N-acyltransferase n=1 Tax=Metarhizium rileyi (strain RCEF 4871) TaxID=1649241 RepID=A0A162JV28_METRR|nr:Acyl-CoA N-acyltransferase [Metarhizium rileyi RCEF 4871]TWU78121.1 hypothetical protein ED733_007305 [Metarhizium rileyi]